MIVLDWFTQNLATVIIALGLLCLCIAIVLKMKRDKKKGRSSCGCGCGCSGCAMSGACHPQSKALPEQADKSQATDNQAK